MTGTVDEDVYITIDGADYMYTLDKAKHDHFFRLLNHAPGKALVYIKAECYGSHKIG